MKRERWGEYILIRPASEATWSRHDRNAWREYDAQFHPSSRTSHSGRWCWRERKTASWHINYQHLSFSIHPTSTKQIGLFPEQSSNWDWSAQQIAKASITPVRLLHLFGYTGGASVAAAAAGATVCHVDSSKTAVQWCSQNARLSGAPQHAIRFIVDDCYKFIVREQRRQRRYDAIILDPPTFGRGPSGELWRLEDHLEELLTACLELLTPSPLFLLLNTYSPHLSVAVLKKIFTTLLKKRVPLSQQILPLALRGSRDGKILPCGIASRIAWR